jgi:L-ascorbate metabolism protein UlaG (beta-lactamase superfamily)
MKVIILSLVFIFSIIILKQYSHKYYYGPVSDHFNGDVFHNLEANELKTFSEVIKWKFTSKTPKWPSWIETNQAQTPPQNTQKDVRITFVNHATFLIQTPKLNILTDPVWSKRASPFSFLGPRRVKSPGINIDQLPHIEVILISHNHYDHLDIRTIKKLEQKFKPLIITGLGVCKAYLSKVIDKKRCIELDWWQTFKIADKADIHFLPAKHWSRRGLFDTNKTLWGGFMIQTKSENIYFSGDTGYGSATEVNLIKNKFKNIDIAILPIGAYKPIWFMKDVHITPEQAILIHKILKPKKTIAMQFGTFPLADEDYKEPMIDLENAKKKFNIKKNEFITLENGDFLVY